MFLYQPRPPGRPGSISNACSVRPASSTSFPFFAGGNVAPFAASAASYAVALRFMRASPFSIGAKLK